MSSNRYYYIPANLDIDKLLAHYPFQHIAAFNKDCLYYILNLIVEIPANNKDLIDEAGYTPINAEMLRERIGKEYKKYMEWLVDAGVIETTGSFIIGRKSKPYRYCQRYNGDLTRVLATFQHLSMRLEAEHNMMLVPSSALPTVLLSADKETCSLLPCSANQSASVYSPIIGWYEAGLISIDTVLAHQYNDVLLQYKQHDRSRWDDTLGKNGKRTKKNPGVQHRANYMNIDKISRGIFNAHPDENVYRFHSALTNCKKELRNAITLAGSKVAVVDLSNSQPTLLTILLNPDFITGVSECIRPDMIPGFDLNAAFSNSTLYHSFITLCKNNQSNESGECVLREFEEYRWLVQCGQFYPEFRARVEDKTGITVPDSDVKGMFFTVLFTDNRYIGQLEAAPKRVFRDWFPNLYKLTSLIKAKNAANLPILLQRLESYIMYHRIVARVTHERPELPIIPIHDSIATVEGEERYIRQVMKEELKGCLGFTPHFKTELWGSVVLETEIARMKQ